MKTRRLRHLFPALLLPLAVMACDDAKPAGEAASSAAATGSAKASTAKPAKPAAAKSKPAADGPFATFGGFITDAAEAVISAAKGDKPDAKWNLEPLDGSDADKVKDLKISFITAEIEAISEKHGYLRTNVYVFPDGTVRFVKLEHRPGKPHVGVTEGLDKASPELVATTQTVVKALSGDKCELPLMSGDDAKRFPMAPNTPDPEKAIAAAAAKMPDLSPMLTKVCGALKGKGDGWVSRYDDFTVMMVDTSGKADPNAKGGIASASIRSSIRVEDGKLKLGKPRVR